MPRSVRLETIGTRVLIGVLLDSSVGSTYAAKRANIGKALSYKGATEGTVALCEAGAKIAGRLENVQPKGDVGGMVKSGFLRLPFVGNGGVRFGLVWAADTVKALGDVVNPTVANGFSYRCTARAGDFKTHATTEPTWPTTLGATVADDAVTWTCILLTPNALAWSADTAKAVGAVVTATTPNGRAYQAIAAAGDTKTHASTEPTWPTAYGATVVDDQVTWMCIGESDQIPCVSDDPSGFVIGGAAGFVKCCTAHGVTAAELGAQPLKVVGVNESTETCVVEFPADVL